MCEDEEDFWEYSMLPEPWAFLEKGDYRAALDAYATREMLDYRLEGRCLSDVWTCGFGVTLWLMGDRKGAGMVWSRATDEAYRGKFRYSSSGTFQPGLLLWFASVWLENQEWREEAEQFFKKLLGKKRPVIGADFSMRLARLLLHEIDLSEVQTSYKEVAINDPNFEWETLFYGGVRSFEEGDLKNTLRLWEQAKPQTRTKAALEYYLMEHEKKRLEKSS